jgi:hypothetical protein
MNTTDPIMIADADKMRGVSGSCANQFPRNASNHGAPAAGGGARIDGPRTMIPIRVIATPQSGQTKVGRPDSADASAD